LRKTRGRALLCRRVFEHSPHNELSNSFACSNLTSKSNHCRNLREMTGRVWLSDTSRSAARKSFGCRNVRLSPSMQEYTAKPNHCRILRKRWYGSNTTENRSYRGLELGAWYATVMASLPPISEVAHFAARRALPGEHAEQRPELQLPKALPR
jgi:hypothetical protein